jgi:protein-disulfide isomerase
MPAMLSRAVTDRDHAQGRSDAPVTMVEYGDFQCPHCAHAYHVVKALQRHFGAGLRLVYRHFPLVDEHVHAEQAAEASEAAAAQGQFWELYDLLYEHQDALELAHLRTHASTLALDATRWERELRGREYVEHVRQDVDGAIESGVRATPTFYVNGVRHDGPADERTLAALVDDTLRAHRHPSPR